MHSGGDPQDDIRYSPEELIDAASAQGYDAITIANHDCAIFCRRLAAYARGKGVVLIPGMELTWEHKHIVLVNFRDVSEVQTPDDIIARKSAENLVIASHPYFPFARSCGRLLDSRPELFDAVEYSHMYVPGINFNNRAVRRASELGVPLVANSDLHYIHRLGSNYTLVDAEEKSPEAIVAAVKAGRCRIVTRPMRYADFFWTVAKMKVEYVLVKARRLAEGRGCVFR